MKTIRGGDRFEGPVDPAGPVPRAAPLSTLPAGAAKRAQLIC